MSVKEKSLRVKTQSCNSLVEFLRGLLNEEISSDEILKLLKLWDFYNLQLLKIVKNMKIIYKKILVRF